MAAHPLLYFSSYIAFEHANRVQHYHTHEIHKTGMLALKQLHEFTDSQTIVRWKGQQGSSSPTLK